MKKNLVIVVSAALAVCLLVAGGAWWWVQQQSGAKAAPAPAAAPVLDARQAAYVTLEKVVVMLRAESGRSHYVSADLVLRTDRLHEKAVKSALPMLKGVAVRTLSKVSVEQGRAMSIEEWSELLQRDLMAAYETQLDLRPFDGVMLSRLILE